MRQRIWPEIIGFIHLAKKDLKTEYGYEIVFRIKNDKIDSVMQRTTLFKVNVGTLIEDKGSNSILRQYVRNNFEKFKQNYMAMYYYTNSKNKTRITNPSANNRRDDKVADKA